MGRLLIAIIVFVGLIFTSACASVIPQSGYSRKPATKQDKVIARVNDESVSYNEWQSAYENQNTRKKLSEEEFLDAYINYKLGAQRARHLQLDQNPHVQYRIEQYLYNHFLREQFNLLRVHKKQNFKVWKKRFLESMRIRAKFWISPEYRAGRLNQLSSKFVVARVHGEPVYAGNFRQLFRKKLQREYDQWKLMKGYLNFQMVVTKAKAQGWHNRHAVRAATERILFEMVNKVELGQHHLDRKQVKKLYKRERQRANIEVYSLR